MVAAVTALVGGGIGLAETAESTLVAHLLPDRLRGSGGADPPRPTSATSGRTGVTAAV